MKKILVFTAMAVLLVFELVAASAYAGEAMEERNQTYLYDRFEFLPSGSEGTVLITLTYVVPGRDLQDKGLFGIYCDVIKKVFEEEYQKKDQGRVEEYMINILVHPGGVFELSLTRDELKNIERAKNKSDNKTPI